MRLVLFLISCVLFTAQIHAISDDFFPGPQPAGLESDDFFKGIEKKPDRSAFKPLREEFNPVPGKRFDCIPSTDLLGKPLYLGQLKVVNAYLSKTCSFHVYFTIDNKRFRRMMFTEEGAVDFFLSRPEATAARTFYPVSPNKPNLALRISKDQSILEILHPSGEIVEIGTRNGEIIGFSNVTLNPMDWDMDPRDGNSPLKKYNKGVLVDSGVRWGVDPRLPTQGKGAGMKLKTSKVVSRSGRKCKIANYYLYDYIYDYSGEVDHAGFRFSNSQVPKTLDFKELEEIRDSLQPKYRAKFNRKMKLIPRNLAPSEETFDQYISRVCPGF